MLELRDLGILGGRGEGMTEREGEDEEDGCLPRRRMYVPRPIRIRRYRRHDPTLVKVTYADISTGSARCQPSPRAYSDITIDVTRQNYADVRPAASTLKIQAPSSIVRSDD
jgi:hypothetical protein